VVAVGMKLGGMVTGGVMGWAGLGLGRRMVVMQGRGGWHLFVLASPGWGVVSLGKKGGGLWFRRGKMLS